MPAAWRPSLPKQSSDISITPMSNILRTTMDVGPAKVRRRSTKEILRVTVSNVAFTAQQVKEFDDFWTNDLGGGVGTFTWEDPRTDESTTYRFVVRPVFSMIAGGEHQRRLYLATLELEVP